MMMIFKYILLFYFFSSINGLFRLYNTNVSDNNDYKDCLYSFRLEDEINEWQLIPYCIRYNPENSTMNDKECYGNINLTFEQLKSKNISSENLYKWNAPIDTINNYEKYLINNDLLLNNYLYCNCSNNFFGIYCEYSFNQSDETMSFDEIILNQFEKKESLTYIYKIVNDPSLLTCYEGIQCHSTICLDWRQICDGIFDCEKGEDEPKDCLLLEINQCNNNEFRCQSGMCIPKTFLIDISYDCVDLTDEKEIYSGEFSETRMFSYKSTRLIFDFSICQSGLFSCGDGECATYIDSYPVCNNGRDLFFRRNLYLSSLSNNISFQCWSLMLCMSHEANFNLFQYDNLKCNCTRTSSKDKNCLKYFDEFCPSLFYFQTEFNFLYPFVQLLFNKTSRISLEWWKPTHLCYNEKYCSVFPLGGISFIDGFVCIESPDKFIIILRRLFSSCSIPHTLVSIEDKRLFYCNRSMKFISKHRVKDTFIDCFYLEDEDTNDKSTLMYSLNLTDRFKCTQDNKWIPRPLMLYDDNDHDDVCEDNSHRLHIGTCKNPSDLICDIIRGIYFPSVYYVFRENCNNKIKLHFLIKNQTDETDCEEWSTNRCDDYWDTKNGEDELNCKDKISSYITQTIYKCTINEHYCIDRNGNVSCLPKERAGDGIIDCLGQSDETTTNIDICREHWEGPDLDLSDNLFTCSDGYCMIIFDLCDGIDDCDENDDELACPWVIDSTCRLSRQFPCKNGTCIDRYEQQCNGIIDCQPDGEDEWFCDFYIEKSLQFSLNNLEEYPSIANNLSQSTIINDFHSTPKLLTTKIISANVNPLDDWYCNRGIIVKYRSTGRKCLCPPSYYGMRCEYQSERVLITVRIDIPISLSRYQNKESAIRIIARLMIDDDFVHHEQILQVSSMKQMFYLNYPRPVPKKHGNWSVRFDAFSITKSDVNFKAAWLFYVPFSFLPVNRLVLHLIIRDSEMCDTLNCNHGICRKYLNSPHDEYCQCEPNWSGKYCNISNICPCIQNGKCVDGYSRSICVCPLGRTGSECRVLFDPCIDIKCQHGGICLPMDERESTKFICSCPNAYYGSYCELINAEIDIVLSESLSINNRPLSATMLVYFLELEDDSPGISILQNRFLYKQVKSNTPLRVFNNNHEYLSSFILLQIFFEANIFDYYIAGIIKKDLTKINTLIEKLNRCPYVDEVILNETVRKFPSIKKVKYYHYACDAKTSPRCFHDEDFLCFCDRYHQPDCLFFQRESTQCTTDYCKNNGQCVQNNFNGMIDFDCVCTGCAYGSLCQLTTSQYVLSLDVMLGQDIRESMSLTEQPLLIKIVLTIIILMVFLGALSNVLSLMTFKQPKVQEYGCGIYLFCLPLIGQTGLLILAGRFFYFLQTQLYNVNNRSAAHWSCIGLEYFLSVCPILFDWLIVCIAAERSVNLIKGVSFKKSDSVWWAKRIILLITFIVLCSSWHEPFIRELIDDPRATSQHTWCVITFPWLWIKYYRLTVNLINLIVPGLINLIATIFLLYKSTVRKHALVKDKSKKSYLITFKKQLPQYGSPFGLVIFSLIRLIFSFTLVCITHQWQKYVYVTAYLISFAPLMGTFLIFVLPAKNYKTEFKNVIARINRKWRARWM